MSGDPAMGDYVPKAPINDEAKKHNEKLPGMGGVFNTVNLHTYHYAGNNPVKYVDPDGRAAWDKTTSWSAGLEPKFRNKFVSNASSLAKNARNNGEVIDCADLTLTAFIETASSMGLSVTFTVYDSKQKDYVRISSNDDKFSSKKEFIDYVKKNMGVETLLDWQITDDIDQPKKGDLILCDLRKDKSHLYAGHTKIALTDPDSSNKISTAQGHISPQLPDDNEDYTLGDFIYGEPPKYKEFRYESILK